MDGLWNGGPAYEKLDQDQLTRHRILQVNCGADLTTGWNSGDASGLASEDPNNISPDTHNAVTDVGVEGGPHFVMSPTTPDTIRTLGFEVCFFTNGIANINAALPDSGGWDVTVWVLISNTQYAWGATTPVWASLATNTGVGQRELFHSFDVNSTCVRFQFGNLADDPATNNKSLFIAFAEL